MGARAALQSDIPASSLAAAMAAVDSGLIVLEPSAAQAVAVILHELATNASKYGALSDMKGQVRLTWSHAADGQLVLRWTEFDGPSVSAPERRGFGSRLIEGTIGQLGGNACFDWRSEGLVCEIRLQV